MAVNIVFIDPSTGLEISKDKATGGINQGIIRAGQAHIVPVILKNTGDAPATGVYVKASPLNASNEVTPEEYARQHIADDWLMFSLLPDKNFVSQLSLPEIAVGAKMIGKKESIDEFTNPQNSAWVNDLLTTHTFQWTGTSLKFLPLGASVSCFSRADATGWGPQKEIDFTCKFDFFGNATAGSAFTMFGFRMNANGDERGYLVNCKRSTATGLIFFEIRINGAGVRVNGTTEFGTVAFTSNGVPYVPFSPIRIKLFTNTNNLPEIKIWYNNIKDADQPITWGATNPVTSYVDATNKYAVAGGICAIFGTGVGGYLELDQATLLSDDPDGKIYIRTVIGDGAIDNQEYASGIEVFYNP